MKKTLVLTALATTMVTGAAFAAAVPVTNIEDGQSKVQVTYMTAQKLHSDDVKYDMKHNVGAGLETAISPNWAIQYSYNPMKTKSFSEETPTKEPEGKTVSTYSAELKVHELVGVYKYNANVNFYGGAQYLKTTVKQTEVKTANQKTTTTSDKETHNRLGFVAGVIGHTNLTDNVEAFAKLGFGNKMSYDATVGATYKVMPQLGLTVSYDFNKFKMQDDVKAKHKGLNLAVGYSF